jgi:hypothetical protein
MARTLVACVVLALLPLAGPAGDPPAVTVVAFEVDATPAPKAALRYPLLPEMRDLNPGNPAQAYQTCFAEQENFFYNKTSFENRDKWLTMPLHELPVKELHDYGAVPLRQADYAARLDAPDWQTLHRLRRDGATALLPELSQMRLLATALQVRWRVELAERRFDDALRTAQTMFALSRHLGEYPTDIASLVAILVSRMSLAGLEEMVQQPGCPSLYWSLSDLPQPFIDLRKGLQGSRLLDSVEFARFDSATPLTAEQLERAAARMVQLIDSMQLQFALAAPDFKGPLPPSPPRPPRKTAREWLDWRTGDATFVSVARKRLAETGLTAGAAEKLPALQVVLLDEKREYEMRRDEVEKWAGFPFWQAEAALIRAPGKNDDWLFSRMGTAAEILRNRARLEQRFAMLRYVEAFRLYAAEKGRLPDSLADVGVPLPVDPVTGQPFPYRVVGRKGILRGTPPRGREKNAAFNVQFEVTIR